MRRSLRPVAWLLCWQLLSTSMLRAQDPGGLRITVLAGEGATNSIGTGQATAPVIQILDAQGNPAAGAQVTFQSPPTGPSVTFYGAAHTATVETDREGRAAPSTILANTYEGPFTIAISASHQGRTATAAVQQTNTAPEPPRKKRFFTARVVAGIAAAVTIIIIAIARSGDEG